MTELVQIEKRFDDKMWIITILEGTREAVDAWEQTVRDYIDKHSGSLELYLIYDTTLIQNLNFTRYLQQRATILAKENRDVTGRVGIALRIPSMIRHFFDVFINVIGSRIQRKLRVKIFTQREEAVAWVSEVVPSKD